MFRPSQQRRKAAPLLSWGADDGELKFAIEKRDRVHSHVVTVQWRGQDVLAVGGADGLVRMFAYDGEAVDLLHIGERITAIDLASEITGAARLGEIA